MKIFVLSGSLCFDIVSFSFYLFVKMFSRLGLIVKDNQKGKKKKKLINFLKTAVIRQKVVRVRLKGG
jgi:hypothetical protein